jgi:tetratricopeptide (TPR) repeat protein
MLVRSQISYYEGDLRKAYEQQEVVLKTFQDSKQYYPLGFGYDMMGNISCQLGDYDDAIKFYRKSLKYREKHDREVHVALTYLELIGIYAIKRDNVNLRNCLAELNKLNKISNNRILNSINDVGKAINLRYGRDQTKQSKEIFQNIILDKSMLFATTEISYLYICDILFEEVRKSKDINLLSKLNSYIKEFTDSAEKNQAYLLLIELYFLQSKLSTLEFKTDISLSLLERAQEVAKGIE